MRKNFIRVKTTYCGQYVEKDIIPRTESGEVAVKGRRGKRIRISTPKQRNINDINARRYLVQLGNGNFTCVDLHVTATYKDKYLPKTVEEAEREISNYLDRIIYHRKKRGISPLKYILVTEYKFSKDGTQLKRIHHHIIMNAGLGRDDVEDLWSKGRGKKKERIGFINADRLQPNENGIEGLCKYLVKDPVSKKRWSSSRNLIRPEQTKNDSKYSRREVERLATHPDLLGEMQKKYKDYEITEATPVYYDETGWHIYLKMWKRKKGG